MNTNIKTRLKLVNLWMDCIVDCSVARTTKTIRLGDVEKNKTVGHTTPDRRCGIQTNDASTKQTNKGFRQLDRSPDALD